MFILALGTSCNFLMLRGVFLLYSLNDFLCSINLLAPLQTSFEMKINWLVNQSMIIPALVRILICDNNNINTEHVRLIHIYIICTTTQYERIIGRAGCCSGFVAQWLWWLQSDSLGLNPAVAGFSLLLSPQAG